MTSFWLSNPCVLTSSLNLFPFGDELNKNFNAIARVIIIFTVVLTFAFEQESELIMMSGGFALMISVLLYFMITRMSVSFSREDMRSFFGERERNVNPTTKVRGLHGTKISDFYGISRQNF